MKRFRQDDRKRKRDEAAARQKVYDKLSLKKKLALLDSRPGESKRERERLLKEV